MTEIVQRVETPRGELVLRRRDQHFEIISNGVFLMDTTDGRSERLLVHAALAAAAEVSAPRLVIGGLGVGFSLAEAIGHPQITDITVVEIEPAVIEWYRVHLGGGEPDDRVTIVCADLLLWLDEPGPRYDAICVDIDNGPQWTVTEHNRELYGDAGLDRLRRRLADGGVFGVWSAARSRSFEDRLRRHFSTLDIHEIPVPRGEPDVVYITR